MPYEPVLPPAPYASALQRAHYTGTPYNARFSNAFNAAVAGSFASALGNKFRSNLNNRVYKDRLGGNYQLEDSMPLYGRRIRSRTLNVARRRTRFARRRMVRRIRRPVPTLWPQQKLVKFRVAQAIAPTAAGSTTTDVLVFRANSLSDPFASSGANLPLGLDQWAAMYSKYCVVGSRMYVQFHGETSNTGSTVVGVHTLRESSGLTQLEHYKESPSGRSVLISPDNDKGSLVASYSLKGFDKIRRPKLAEDYQATFSTTPGDPAEIRYFHLWYQDTDKTSTCAMEFVVTIEYVVLLWESVIPSRSSL